MSIFIKINSRIKLSSYDESSFAFIVDEKRTANFYTQIPGLDLILLAFLRDGKSLDELMKENLKEKKLSRFIEFIEYLKKNNLIEFQFHLGITKTAIIRPTTHNFKDSSFSLLGFVLEETPYILSRFAYFRRETDKIILESPLAPFKVSFDDGLLVHILPFITGKMSLRDFNSDTNEYDQAKKLFFKLLIEYGFIHSIKESEADNLYHWEFHDLIFHSNSRRGRLDDGVNFGTTYRFQKKLNSPQAFKEIDLGNIELYKPNLESLARTDIPFSKVLEDRKSIRDYNKNKPINIQELGELLYRSVRVSEVVNTPMQVGVYRPYPSAGAIHEIEFYLVVNSCEGLDPDVYYYHPLYHVLSKKNIGKRHIEKLVTNAKFAMGESATNPQILFVLTSNFDKIAWKYEKMAYRSTLISMGTIFQTLSLVATSMNLASCIVGSGDSSYFSEVLEMDSLKEGAIGEFAIGRKVP